MLIASIVGTRPNFVKEYLINKELKKNNIEEILIHTGQHYDYEMSKLFFDNFNLPSPDFHLEKRGATNIKHTVLMMEFLEEIFISKKPDGVLVYGDVNSTLAAAIVSAKLDIPVIHIEGGVRSKHLYNPEEINRRVTDSVSKLIFAATQNDYDNLVKENFEKERIILSGDLMKDTILEIVKRENIEIKQEDYLVCTIHRQENVNSKQRLTNIINAMIKSGKKIYFPAHPRTMNKIKEYGLLSKLEDSNVKLLTPQGYTAFIRLLAGAKKVLTDSGGVRREAYILGKPVILLIDIVWFPEIHKAGYAFVANDSEEKIMLAINNFVPNKPHINIFGDGKSYKKIVQHIKNYLTTNSL